VGKATEKQTQAKNRELNDGLRGIVDIDNPRMTAHMLVNELVTVLYLSHSNVKLYRPTSVVEIAAISIDVIRNNHSSTESFLIMLLHLGYLTEHGTYQRTLNIL